MNWIIFLYFETNEEWCGDGLRFGSWFDIEGGETGERDIEEKRKRKGKKKTRRKKSGGYVGEWRKGQDRNICELGPLPPFSLSYICCLGRGPLYTCHNLRTVNTTNLQLWWWPHYPPPPPPPLPPPPPPPPPPQSPLFPPTPPLLLLLPWFPSFN